MSNAFNTFWEAFDECQREVRAEIAGKERVIPLRDDLTPAQRRTIVQQSLARGVMQLEMLGNDAADDEMLAVLDSAIKTLVRRKVALQMHLGLVSLTGQFGRAPT